MDVRGPLPFSPLAAKAYGIRLATPAAPAANVASATRMSQLTAGTVSVPADPGLAPDATPQGAFAMYNRAADRVEVATKVAIGTAIDTRA